ncbi:hypothetical protein L0222_05000 [bacterium]|nr:hypothetical protein [bacterium]
MKYLIVFLFFICASLEAEMKLEISKDLREDGLRQGQVWRPVDVSKMDILAGPQTEVSARLNSQVECEYIEPKEQLKGRWPKFLCKTPKGHVVRVKYGEQNKEIYAEAAASRLFWALGFYADDVYPVEVKCNNCPENPFKPEEGKRGTYLFKDAVIERNFPGEVIEEKEDQGWTWKELEKVKTDEGGAPRSHIDALRLLAVFVQHADAKPDNQRIGCYPDQIADLDRDGKGYCTQPVLMVQDLGATFGSGLNVMSISRVDLKSWESKEIWNTALEAKTREKKGAGIVSATSQVLILLPKKVSRIPSSRKKGASSWLVCLVNYPINRFAIFFVSAGSTSWVT